MRFTTIVNLPVVFLALVIGAAAVPRDVYHNPETYPKVKGPSHQFFFNPLRILTLFIVV